MAGVIVRKSCQGQSQSEAEQGQAVAEWKTNKAGNQNPLCSPVDCDIFRNTLQQRFEPGRLNTGMCVRSHRRVTM